MSFDRIRYQDAAVRFLRSAVAGERLAHALLLVGPRGTGKGLAARELAKLLLCPSPRGSGAGDLDPCDACSHCRRVVRRAHPDLYWFQKEPDRNDFRLPLVTRREGENGTPLWLTVTVNESLHRTPMEARRTVTVLDDAELLNEEAAGALLKSLEEPSAWAVVVLLCADASRLPGTVLSRCQWVRFRALPAEFVAEKLKELAPAGPSGDEMAYVSRLAGGSIEQALALVGSGLWDLKKQLVAGLAGMDEASALDLAGRIETWARSRARAAKAKAGSPEETAVRRDSARTALAAASSALRDAAVLGSSEKPEAARAAVPLTNADQPDAAAALAAWGPEALARAVDLLADAQGQIARYVHPELATENALIQLCRLALRR
jgi:DNA polymerase III gamma/tau subunit